MPNRVTLIVHSLKITDCADDDEDMDINLSIYVNPGTQREKRVFTKTYSDVYVEEEGKVGNDSKCTFFTDTQLEELSDVESVKFSVVLTSLDGDGNSWGGPRWHFGPYRIPLPKGDHVHVCQVGHLPPGRYDFKENRHNSSIPESEGQYELTYSVVVA